MKNKKTIVFSLITILCFSVIVGVFIFFMLRNSSPTHIQAEGLTIELKRTKLTQYCLGPDGKMHTVEDEETKDFSKDQSENIFGLTDGDIVVPSSRYQADLMVNSVNKEAFAYWIMIDLSEGGNAFAEQLAVTITIKDGLEQSFRLSNAKTLGSEQDPLVVVKENKISYFTVKVYFVDDQFINDDAINQSIYFDLILCAVQS